MSVGHWSAGDFCDRFAPPGYHSDDPGVPQRLRGAVPADQGGRRRRDRDPPERVREDAQRRPRSRGDRARAERLSRRARHDASPPATSTPGRNPKFRLGGPCNPDPALRRAALEEVLKGVEICRLMKIPVLSVWPGSDGADYHFQIDYKQSIEWFTEALIAVNKEVPRSTASSWRSSRSRTSRASST